MPNYEAIVVGAGPAGSAAAITLAKANHRTLLLDKVAFPRDKICGDGLTSDALKLLAELGVLPNPDTELDSFLPVDEMVVSSPSGRSISYPLKSISTSSSLAAVVKRKELDMALLTKAQGVGVQTSLNTALTSVIPKGDHLEIQTSDSRRFTTSYLFAADGIWSNTRKYLGMNSPTKYLGDWHAFRQYFTGVSENISSSLHVWFEEDILPGYVWAFPLENGSANVGFGVSRSTHKTGQLSRLFAEILKRPHIQHIVGKNATPVDSPRAWPIPTKLGKIPLVGPRTFFIGDAAAVADPMTGEGIAQALNTGILAARAAIQNPTNGATDAYKSAVRKTIEADNRLARLIGKVLKKPLGARVAIRISGSNPWFRHNFARWLLEDYPRALAFTPRRWKARRQTNLAS